MNDSLYLILPIVAFGYLMIYLPFFWRPPQRSNLLSTAPANSRDRSDIHAASAQRGDPLPFRRARRAGSVNRCRRPQYRLHRDGRVLSRVATFIRT